MLIARDGSAMTAAGPKAKPDVRAEGVCAGCRTGRPAEKPATTARARGARCRRCGQPIHDEATDL